MKNLEVEEILEYYDVPQLFTAIDEFGQRYICLLYEITEDGGMKMVGVEVSTMGLVKFLDGEVDLLSMFLNPEPGYHTVNVFRGLFGKLHAETRNGPLEKCMLPEKGYFYKKNADEEEGV